MSCLRGLFKKSYLGIASLLFISQKNLWDGLKLNSESYLFLMNLLIIESIFFSGLKGLVACSNTIMSGLSVKFSNRCEIALSVVAVSPAIDFGLLIILTSFYKPTLEILSLSVDTYTFEISFDFFA